MIYHKMDDLKDTSLINRLNEFYDFREIDWYLKNVRLNNLESREALLYLYDRTLGEYTSGVEPDPNINDYTLRFLLYKGKCIKE